MFSTLQRINEHSVISNCIKKEDRLSMNPAENPGRHICPPVQQNASEEKYWVVCATAGREAYNPGQRITNS